jgi:tetratricopeptide (TPR) repeat protein
MFRCLLLAALLIAPPAFAGEPISDLLRAGQIAEAVQSAEASAKARPSDLDAQEEWIDLLLSLGIAGHAQQHYAQLLQAHPEDPNLHYLAGRAALSPETSRKAYERALRLNPEHPRAHMGMGALHRAAGDLGAAAAAYQRALLGDAKLAEAWGGLLACYLGAGDRDGALKVAKVAMEAVPQDAEAYLAYAMLDPTQAGLVLREAVSEVPGDARVHASMAEQLLLEGQPEQARRAARLALGIAPDHPGALLALMFADAIASGSLDRQGLEALIDARQQARTDPTGARATLDALAVRYPRAALVPTTRGHLRLAADPAGARQDFEAALRLDPNQVEAQAALGLLLHRAGEHSRAVPLLTAAAAARPTDARLAVALANSSFTVGQRDAALRTIERAQAVNPFDVAVVLTRAHLLASWGKHQDAYDVVSTASELIPDVRVIMAVGAAAAELGRYEEAIEIYDMLAGRSGDAKLAETARQLRAKAAAAQ